jgi:hypothetical protein
MLSWNVPGIASKPTGTDKQSPWRAEAAPFLNADCLEC